MGFREQLAALKEIDIADLELSEVATWPLAARRTVLVLVAALTLLLGYSMLLSPAFDALGRAAQEEQRLRDELRTQAPYAAAVPALQDQQALLVERFEALLGQLPTETEVPALLDDISRVGMESGLKFRAIALQPEQLDAYYYTLPIAIEVEGAYHDLGRFMSGLAALSRIVTLHDFSLIPKDEDERLLLKLEARTYRYRGEGTP
jgi:type IV pilus assembly protein PilO